MKIYISGAITGTEDYKTKFDRAEQFIKNLGHEALNPTWINAELDYSEYMEIDIAMLKVADAILMLDNWEFSRGACYELETAKLHEKLIFMDSVELARYNKN